MNRQPTAWHYNPAMELILFIVIPAVFLLTSAMIYALLPRSWKH